MVEVGIEVVIRHASDVGEDPERPHRQGSKHGPPQVSRAGLSGGDGTELEPEAETEDQKGDGLCRCQPAVRATAATAPGVCQATTRRGRPR